MSPGTNLVQPRQLAVAELSVHPPVSSYGVHLERMLAYERTIDRVAERLRRGVERPLAKREPSDCVIYPAICSLLRTVVRFFTKTRRPQSPPESDRLQLPRSSMEQNRAEIDSRIAFYRAEAARLER